MSNGPRYRGKTFHEYMSAKFWHPASKRNIVTVWKRKQQMEADKRKAQERAEEARKENEKNLVQKALGDKKAMSGVSFLYEMPNNIMPKDINAPENQGDRPGQTAKNFEIKFEWQKNAPRDSHFNTMGEVRNSIFNHKPFGIEVRNVKCMKCGEFGHSNVDRVCPMYGKVGDRDNPEWDLKKEQMEILASRLTQNSGFKLKDVAKQHVGDLSFDPSEKKSKKRREKEGEIEMEFLKTLNPKEKEQLLEKLEEQRRRKKQAEKKRKKAVKKELKAEMAKQLASSKSAIRHPKLEFEQKPIVESDDEEDEPGPSTPVNITLPKRKDEDEKAKILAAKKEFARKLAEIKHMMEQESDSSDDDSSDESDESDSDDSDYETGSSPDAAQKKDLPKNMPPPPKPGMILVKKKRAAPAAKNNEDDDAKRKRIEDLKALESQMKMVRKRLAEKQKTELEESTRRLQESKKPRKEVEPTPIVNEDDLTSGLLDCIDSSRTQWKPTSLIAYDSDSD